MTAVVETFTRLLNIADVDINSVAVDVVVGDPDIFLLTLLTLMLTMFFLQLLTSRWHYCCSREDHILVHEQFSDHFRDSAKNYLADFFS